MELYDKLARIFELSTIDIEKSNRKTLLNYAKRSRFQKRRESFCVETELHRARYDTRRRSVKQEEVRARLGAS